jgi:biopolymer transport protein ExbB/TolQ
MENAFSIAGIWHNMGTFARGIVAIMFVMSIASGYVIFDRWMLFRKSMTESRAFASKMGSMLSKGDLKAAAAAKLGQDVGYLGRVIGAGLATYRVNATASPDFVFESVARALERQAAREAASLKKGIAVLATVASTAPFIGLLGTVTGIINSFVSMAASGSGGLGTVSAGIAEALATTAVGLAVAIIAVIAYNSLQGWVDARGVDIAESSNEFLDLVAKKLATAEAPAAEAAE